VSIRLTVSLCFEASAASIASAPVCAQLSSNATVYASGLESPRGLKFGPDGDLYVAEAGSGGTISTVTTCPTTQVPPPIGPYLGGSTGRISKLDKSGNRTTVASGFPSSLAAEGDLQGVADIAISQWHPLRRHRWRRLHHKPRPCLQKNKTAGGLQ
jgi:hypothetical protein